MPPSVITEMVVDTQIATVSSLPLDCGVMLFNLQIAYETYGTLNKDRSNAILLLHAFTGDAHAAGIHAQTGQPGWWSDMVGPGLAFDTDKYFLICSNVLGGCQGTTGPGSINPATGQRYGMSFPVITISDMVRLQKQLIDLLGIERLLAVAGGSMGGMQALEWTVAYPDSVRAAITIASTSRHSAQQIAFNEVGRQAIVSDPDWNEGEYYDGKVPGRGLAIARMVGHITYMSDGSMRQKFGRRLRDKDAFGFRFLSGLRSGELPALSRAASSSRASTRTRICTSRRRWITSILSSGHASLGAAFEKAQARFLVISFTSDWLYPTYQSLETVSASAEPRRGCGLLRAEIHVWS